MSSDKEWKPTHDEYDIITTPEELDALLTEMGSDPIAALDFEGWNIVRLAQICNDDVWTVVDFGETKVNWFDEVAHWFEDGRWIVFNSGHEKRWFARHDSYPTCWDAGYLRRAIEGGGHMSLKLLAGWELGIEMDKGEQGSAWDDGELTDSQLDYAADDALITWDIWKKLKARATPGNMECFNLLDGMADGVIEMEESGLRLDVDYHRTLIKQWQDLRAERNAQIRELVTESEVPNLNSGKQLNDFFSHLLPVEVLNTWPKTPKTGLLSTKNKDLLNMAGVFGGTPLGDVFRLLAERSTLEKYLSSFGETLITHAKHGKGRVRARYNIAAAITCRFSSSGPNLQQIPRDRDFFGERLSIRKGFIPEPGNLMVSFDYSGIEMVMMALLSGDEQLLEDVIYGDPHSVMGEYVLGRPLDRSTVEDNEMRQSMKSVNFGIIYGTSALGLAGRQGWAFSYADGLLNYWASRYPKAWAYRTQVKAQAIENGGYATMIDGGTIFMGPPEKLKKSRSMTKFANYPVQRAALSVMARAIIRHKDSMDNLRDLYPRDADRLLFCSTIHDALIDEAKKSLAPLVMETMKQDMLEAYYDIFPEIRGAPEDKLLEGGLGPSWGELDK